MSDPNGKEDKKSGKWGEIYFGLIQIMKITSFLSKAQNWKSPGND
jgi:hypothetical protein